MAYLNRRTALRALGAASAAQFLSTVPDDSSAIAAASAIPPAPSAAGPYRSNTELYAAAGVVEGVDYARRYRRHAALDDTATGRLAFPDTVVLALHGGGIEPGTTELCLAVAGYHPATLAAMTPSGPGYDYWMFEGLRPSGNTELHVPSTHCDDPVATALSAGSRQTLSLHGCTTQSAGLPDNAAAVLVGGLDTVLKERLLAAYRAAGIPAKDATGHANLGGTEPTNIANRNLERRGLQLELTTELRLAMFTVHTRLQRKHTTTELFWRFVTRTRATLERRSRRDDRASSVRGIRSRHG